MTDCNRSQEHELLRSALEGTLGNVLLKLWQRTRMDWGFVTDRLAGAFRDEKALGSAERRFVAEVLFDMVRHASRIDAALELGGLRSVGRAPDRKRLIACLLLEHGLDVSQARSADPDLDWSEVARIDEVLANLKDPVDRLAKGHSLPGFLARALVEDLGAVGAIAFARAANQRAPMTVRCNMLKGTRVELQALLAEEGIESRPCEHSLAGLHIETRTNLFGLKAFSEGWFEAQDEGSQLIAELVAPPPRSVVVDYCAGAGGKSLAMAALLQNRGKVLASDVSPRKLKELRRRAKRAGVNNIQVVELASELDSAFPKPFAAMLGKADRVLVDAPCTGIGALRRNPEARWRLGESELSKMPQLQGQILRKALELVAPGGRLIYATCTVLHRENREVVEGLLRERPEVAIVLPKEIWGKERAAGIVDESERFLQTRPDLHGCDGFFAAVLRIP